MDSKTQFRPSIPWDLKKAAMAAGAPMGLSPRDYIVLALRYALWIADELPDTRALSPAERVAVTGRKDRSDDADAI